MSEPVDVRHLASDDLHLLARIDRSESVTVEFEVREGQIAERPVSMAEVPSWPTTGTGPHSVAAQRAFCADLLDRGAHFLGAFADRELLGVAVVDAHFERTRAWLAYLHVSRPHRRRGAASALWSEAISLARSAGATSMYVSATPTGSAVGFYLSRGCTLADPVHPELHALEPDDIHLVCAVDSTR